MTIAVAAVAVFSLVIGALSLLGVIQPRQLTGMIINAMRTWGFPTAIIVRILFAAALWFAAGASRTPLTFQLLAVFALIGALVLQILGRDRSIKLMQGIEKWPNSAIRLWCAVGVGLAIFLAIAIRLI